MWALCMGIACKPLLGAAVSVALFQSLFRYPLRVCDDWVITAMTEIVWSPLEPASLWQAAALAPQPLSAPADPGSDSDSTAAILARGTVSVGAVIPQAPPSISIAATPPAATLLSMILGLSVHCSRSAALAPLKQPLPGLPAPCAPRHTGPQTEMRSAVMPTLFSIGAAQDSAGARRAGRPGAGGRLSACALPASQLSDPLQLCCALPMQIVVIRGNARTKASLIGQRAVVRRAVGLGGWHWLQVRRCD